MQYFYNGKIRTMNARRDVAPHMLLAGKKVLFCSSERAPLGLDFRESGFEQTRRSVSTDVEFVDLKGKTVLPGLIDSHVHFVWWALNQSHADLTTASSESEAVDILRQRARNPVRGEWVLGFGWSHNVWPESRLPSRGQLDAAFPDNPVFLRSKCGHLAWVNAAALQTAGLSAASVNPPGGEIQREEGNGQRGLTGILKETAVSLVSEKINEPGESARLDALRYGQQVAHSMGITSMQTPEDLDTWEFLQKVRARDELRIRIGFWIPAAALDHLQSLRIRRGLGDEWLRIDAVKVFTDGSLGGRTALMYDPYENEPDNRGICVTGEEELTELAIGANRIGLPVAAHAIGDKAVGCVLSAFESAAEKAGTNRGGDPIRNRIEHLQVFHPSDLDRLRRLRPVASMQPIHLCADMGPAEKFWGDRSRFAYAFRTLEEAGCLLAFGSDAPVEPINPFAGMFAAATRRNLQNEPPDGWFSEERIPVQTALEAYTCNPAVAAGQQANQGELASGRLADFLVLDEDPVEVAPENLLKMKPVTTFVGGERVFGSEEWHDN